MNQNLERLTFRAPELLRPALESYLSFDAERFTAHFSEDAVLDDSRLRIPIYGREGISDYFKETFGKILSFHLHRSQTLAIRNAFLVIIEATVVRKACPESPLLYFGATNVEFNKSGLIRHYRTFIDPQAILQLGGVSASDILEK